MAIAIELLLTLLTLSGLVYTALALLAARSFARSISSATPSGTPPDGSLLNPSVSLLKPLKGADEELFAALASHCLQQYDGALEILCGVSTADDPAAAVVAQLQVQYPHVALRLIVCPERLGTSGKVSNLVQMLRAAQYDHVLINDSDIHVGPTYLARIMAGFSVLQPKGKQGTRLVGMVTAPYRGRAHTDARGRLPCLVAA